MNKKSADAVLARIRLALGVDNDSELCRQTGVNRQTLSNWKSRNSVPYSLCVELAEEHLISLDWLLTGEGVMNKNGFVNEVRESSLPELTPRQKAVLGLFDALPDDKQREILSALEDKKRIQELEDNYKELREALDALKNTG
jgi:transcriptional regulator with XRE-family HTH domain